MRARSSIGKAVSLREHVGYTADPRTEARVTAQEEFNRELLPLLQTKGWLYAQRVALEVQNEFRCKPTDPNWLVYTTIQYAFNQLFDQVKQRAKSVDESVKTGQSILAEIKEKNAGSNHRGDEPASTTVKRGRRGSTRS